MHDQTLRHQILDASIRMLALTDGLDFLKSVRVTLINDDTGTKLMLNAQQVDLFREEVIPGQFSPVEKAILRVITPMPKAVKVLARMAGYAVSNHFREALRNLERRNPPLVTRMPDGYRLASVANQPVPPFEETTLDVEDNLDPAPDQKPAKPGKPRAV